MRVNDVNEWRSRQRRRHQTNKPNICKPLSCTNTLAVECGEWRWRRRRIRHRKRDAQHTIFMSEFVDRCSDALGSGIMHLDMNSNPAWVHHLRSTSLADRVGMMNKSLFTAIDRTTPYTKIIMWTGEYTINVFINNLDAITVIYGFIHRHSWVLVEGFEFSNVNQMTSSSFTSTDLKLA